MLGADLQNPRFAELAETFGIRSARVDSPDELEQVLQQNAGTSRFLLS